MNPTELKTKLVGSIVDLENAVSAASIGISKKFGDNSHFVHRLNNYLSAIDHQKNLVKDLSDALDTNNFGETARLVILINSISSMIKDDAKALLEEMSTGSACVVDDDMIH